MKNNIKKIMLGLILVLLCSSSLFACSNSNPAYSITVLPCENGKLTLVNPSVSPMNTVFVTIAPDTGFQFKEGSLKITPFSSYNITENTATFRMSEAHITISAEFEELTRTYTYDYQDATSDTSVKNIKLEYNSVAQTSFIVPQRENCIFDGWYLGDDPFGFYKKVSDENGNVVIGTEAFDNPFDTLYARWIAIDGPVYPVLMVYVNEVKATFKTFSGKSIEVDYKLSETEKQICEMVTQQVWGCINLMFNGLVNFEFDNYFTTEVVSEESFFTISGYKGDEPFREYILYADRIPEVGALIKNYRSVMTAACLNDYDSLLRDFGGIASNKFAYMPLESILDGLIINKIPIESLFDLTFSQSILYHWEFIKSHYLHEFTHTAEEALNEVGRNVYEYHSVLGKFNNLRDLKITKLYLFNEAEINGQKVGIPFSYWKGEIEVLARYAPYMCEGLSEGKVVIVGTTEQLDWGTSVTIPSSFGSDLMVEAIPKEGYRFVKWSDGITTAVRHDTNLTSLLSVYAIFEKIE